MQFLNLLARSNINIYSNLNTKIIYKKSFNKLTAPMKSSELFSNPKITILLLGGRSSSVTIYAGYTIDMYSYG